MDWAAYRDEFPTLARVTYYNTVSLGAISDRSRARVNGYLDAWTARGSRAWMDTWIDELGDLRARFARLIGARPEEVAIGPSVSYNLNALASAVDLSRAGGRVLCSELDFTTLPYLFQNHPGANVERIASPDGVRQPLQTWKDALAEPAAAVVTSHAFFATGYIQPMQRIAELAHEHDALVVCDAYHTAGQWPIDVKQMGVDVLLSGGLKWLLGGPGVSFMYVDRDVANAMDPDVTGWFANEHQFEFDPDHFEFRDGARRFELGTPSLSSCAAAAGGLDIIGEIGPERIRQRTRALTDDLCDRLVDGGAELAIPGDPDERVAIIMVRHDDAQGAVDRLFKAGIIADARPGAVRLAPYFYNTEDENATVADAVLALL